MQTLKQIMQPKSVLQSISDLSDDGIQKGRSVFQNCSYNWREKDKSIMCARLDFTPC